MKEWDVFISHATEDKADVVLPLADLLQGKGLKVWLDTTEIEVGDSLRAKIDDGLARSRFGVVILSRSFFAKHWTKKELDGLTALEDSGHKVVLPIWHKVGKAEVTSHSPMLAGLYALRTIDGLDEVASRLAEVVLEPGSGSPSAAPPSLGRRLSNLVERNAGREEFFNFFLNHVGIVKIASMRRPYPDVLGIRASDRLEIMGFACWRDDQPDEGITLVIPGPPSNPLFDAKRDPLEPMQECIESIVGLSAVIGRGKAKTGDGRILTARSISARIIAGRLPFMSTDDMLAREGLKEFDVTLRSYDQLVQIVSALVG